MKKKNLFLFVLAIVSVVILTSISKESANTVETKNTGCQTESYSGFDMFSKYNLY